VLPRKQELMQEEARTERLALEIIRSDGLATVHVKGELVWGLTNLLYDAVRKIIPQSKRVVLDFAELTHMDSMGIGTLVRLYVSAKAAGCELELVHVGKRVRELLSVTKLLSVFSICGEHGIRMQ